jgi:hypothetical protein
MPGFANEPLTKLAFSIYQNPGVYALLLGSGISTGWSVTLDLIRRVGTLEGAGDQLESGSGTFHRYTYRERR